MYGLLYQGLKARLDRGGVPITIQTCDNIRKNGDVLSRCLKQYLALTGDAALCAWVDEKCSFPNSMVDRITPRPPSDLDDEIKRLFPNGPSGYSVISESFMQWVIEDKFANDYPDIAKADAQVVRDVHPYEEAKIRILNGGHTVISYLGVLRGHRTYDQVKRHTHKYIHHIHYIITYVHHI